MIRPVAAGEPSMEDILASIRKIIAEEPAGTAPPASQPPVGSATSTGAGAPRDASSGGPVIGPVRDLTAPAAAQSGAQPPASEPSSLGRLADALRTGAATAPEKPHAVDDDLDDLFEDTAAGPQTAGPSATEAGSAEPRSPASLSLRDASTARSSGIPLPSDRRRELPGFGGNVSSTAAPVATPASRAEPRLSDPFPPASSTASGVAGGRREPTFEAPSPPAPEGTRAAGDLGAIVPSRHEMPGRATSEASPAAPAFGRRMTEAAPAPSSTDTDATGPRPSAPEVIAAMPATPESKPAAPKSAPSPAARVPSDPPRPASAAASGERAGTSPPPPASPPSRANDSAPLTRPGFIPSFKSDRQDATPPSASPQQAAPARPAVPTPASPPIASPAPAAKSSSAAPAASPSTEPDLDTTVAAASALDMLAQGFKASAERSRAEAKPTPASSEVSQSGTSAKPSPAGDPAPARAAPAASVTPADDRSVPRDAAATRAAPMSEPPKAAPQSQTQQTAARPAAAPQKASAEPSPAASDTVAKPAADHASAKSPPAQPRDGGSERPAAAAPATVAPPPAPLAAALGAGDVRTLEDTVAELLRPMLRKWLDDNMPRIVEKALRVEIAQDVTALKKPPPR